MSEKPNKIQNYLIRQAEKLNLEFSTIREVHDDSDVKGGINEKVIASFLGKHLKVKEIATNAELIDSEGQTSDEIDVCVCNEYQPFTIDTAIPLLVEGIDFVVQVKATLTTNELERAVRNCESVKKLTRKTSKGDTLFALRGDIPYFVDRTPYLLFSFSSRITLETAQKRLHELSSSMPYFMQPDAIFVLDRGCIINFREGKGRGWTVDGKPLIGYCIAYTEEQTLLEFLRYIYTYITRIRRFVHPLTYYFPFAESSLPYQIKGKTL